MVWTDATVKNQLIIPNSQITIPRQRRGIRDWSIVSQETCRKARKRIWCFHKLVQLSPWHFPFHSKSPTKPANTYLGLPFWLRWSYHWGVWESMVRNHEPHSALLLLEHPDDRNTPAGTRMFTNPVPVITAMYFSHIHQNSSQPF